MTVAQEGGGDHLFEKLGWDNNTLLNIAHYANCAYLTAIRLQLELKIIYMQMLEHINEDFDDDLFQDAI